MTAMILYCLALGCALAAAWLGVDFSPSYTMMFVFAYMGLTALGEILRCFKRSRAFALLGQLFPVLGALFVFPATFIYAFGDDRLFGSIRWVLCLSVIAHVAIWFLLYRRRGRKLGVAAGIENWMLLAAGIFTAACAVPCTALWPFALGILLILAARRLADEEKSAWLPRVATVLGMLLCAAFPVAPMLF